MAKKKIPRVFKKYFWDVDFEKLDPEKKPYFVIQRMLDKGNWEAAKWIVANYKKNQISDTFLRMRDFNARIGNFWANYLNIPREKVLCLQEPYLKMRRQLWPY